MSDRQPIRKFRGVLVPVLSENVDTDQIIPARFLKVTGSTGLADALFYDWRYDENGSPRPDFVLNGVDRSEKLILLAGANFGCGSSREHAPWALLDFGFRAVISTSFADIFNNNSLKNGLLTIRVDEAAHRRLASLAAGQPDVYLVVDLENQTVQAPDGSEFRFPINEFSKKCLLDGVDELGYLWDQGDAIDEYERRVPRRVHTIDELESRNRHP